MFNTLVRRLFGSANDRYVRGLDSIVSNVNELEGALQNLTDEKLKLQTKTLKERLSNGETLDDILPGICFCPRGSKKDFR